MNKTFRTVAVAALALASTLALAQDAGSDAARHDRMESAYQNFKGRMARDGHAIRRGTRNAGHQVGQAARRGGHAVAQATRKTGHAVGTGMRKTGNAIESGGEKLQGSFTPKP